MKILVTGANGQLGHDLQRVLGAEGHQVIALGRDGLDVSNVDEVRRVMHSTRPDGVVHAAAYTAVDRAEAEVEEAFRVNADGSRNIAVTAEQIGAKVIYVSTDYVFDGTLERPYREYDSVGPTSIYGHSKLAGEVLTRTLASRYFIVRTSWVFGIGGNNFVKTMLKIGKERDTLQVVDDQRGCPTYTVDLARFIARLVTSERYGIYHASNTGACTWYEFAKTIFEEAKYTVSVNPCTTEEFPRPAPRPRNSVLDHIAIRTNGFDELPHWGDALRRFLAELQGM